MRYFKFTMQSNDDGFEGLVPNIHRNWPNYNPSDGFAVAHDIMEHGTKETGAFDEEMAAHGGYLFVRRFGTFIPNMLFTTERALAGGMGRQYQESTIGYIREPKKAYGLTKQEIKDIEFFATKYRKELCKDWKLEINEYEDEDEDEGNIPCPFDSDEDWDKLVGWMKYGYARAKRRWKDDGLAYALFQSIERELIREAHTLKIYLDSNMEFTLCLDAENGVAKVKYPYWM
jgi:hypothetical protein